MTADAEFEEGAGCGGEVPRGMLLIVFWPVGPVDACSLVVNVVFPLAQQALRYEGLELEWVIASAAAAQELRLISG